MAQYRFVSLQTGERWENLPEKRSSVVKKSIKRQRQREIDNGK
jgi:hypothetical protein